MGKNKKKWERPKLIVLARGGKEEGVLESCKGVLPTTYGQANGSCIFFMNLGGGRVACAGCMLSGSS